MTKKEAKNKGIVRIIRNVAPYLSMIILGAIVMTFVVFMFVANPPRIEIDKTLSSTVMLGGMTAIGGLGLYGRNGASPNPTA